MIYATKIKKTKKTSKVFADSIDFYKHSHNPEIIKLLNKIHKLPDFQRDNDSVVNFEAYSEVDIERMLALKLMKVEKF